MASQSERGRAAMSSRITHPHRKKQGTEADEEGRRETETAIVWIHERRDSFTPGFLAPVLLYPGHWVCVYLYFLRLYIYAKARDMNSFLGMFNSEVLVDSDG